ncbi:MAG: NADH-quinone oxidoreductase subunit E, partial [Candidatus Marinimicrobia bacterium]|nr:NADH-quinone oxidoreductase subunit E [Actinomycetota bacterium]MBT7973175.1 NADH-quinone oxidoreductase subunit E [Candidatus Neomarinimicrobiota bacterium]
MPDLRFGTTSPTSEEAAAVDAVVAGVGPATVVVGERLVLGGRSRAVARRNLLLPALHALQGAAGWISPGGLDHVCRVLEIPPAEAYGVATFYHLFSHSEPQADSTVHVCDDIVCRTVGAGGLMDDLREAGYQVRPSPCLGQCDRGPAVLVQRTSAEDLSVAPARLQDVETAIGSSGSSSSVTVPQAGSDNLRLLTRVGVVDPGSLDDYRSHGGYAALEAAIDMGPDGVIRELTASG